MIKSIYGWEQMREPIASIFRLVSQTPSRISCGLSRVCVVRSDTTLVFEPPQQHCMKRALDLSTRVGRWLHCAPPAISLIICSALFHPLLTSYIQPLVIHCKTSRKKVLSVLLWNPFVRNATVPLSYWDYG